MIVFYNGTRSTKDGLTVPHTNGHDGVISQYSRLLFDLCLLFLYLVKVIYCTSPLLIILSHTFFNKGMIVIASVC